MNIYVRILIIITLFLSWLGAQNIENDIAIQNMHTAKLYQKQNYDEALSVATKNYRLAIKTLGVTHEEALKAQNNIFALYCKLGKFDIAQKFLLSSLQLIKKKDVKHPQVLILLKKLAELSNILENVEETEKYSIAYLELQKQQLGIENPETLNTVSNLAKFYHERGKYQLAEPLYVECFETRKRVLGEDDAATLSSASNLAALYYQQGKLSNAESLLLLCISRMEKVLGETHLNTLNAINTLCVVYQSQGRYIEAAKYLEQCIKIKQKILGEEHEDTLVSMNNLGICYFGLGENKKAEKTWVQCLGYWEKQDNTNSEVASLQHNLGNLYENQGKYIEAEKALKIGFELRENLYGRKHPKTLVSMGNLGNLCQKLNRYNEAEKLLQECSQSSEEILGKQHPDTLIVINNLAELYKKQGKYTDAEQLFTNYLLYAQNSLGDNHFITLAFMHNIAGVYKKQGKYSDAENLYLNCFNKRKMNLGEEHPDTLDTQNNLGLLYLETGKIEQAQDFFLSCLEIRTRKLGKEHVSTLVSMNNLALLYQSTNEYPKAEPILEECLAIKKKVLGQNHPDTIISMGNLALLYSSQGKHEKAKRYLVDCLKISEENLQKTHPDILLMMADLASVHTDQKQYEKAISLYDKTISEMEKELGKNHIKTLVVKSNFASLYYTKGDFKAAEKLLIACLKSDAEQKQNFTLSCMNSLALVYQRQKRYEDSVLLFEKCLALLKQSSKHNTQTAIFSHNLVASYILQKKYREAFELSKNRIKELQSDIQTLLFGSDKSVQAYFLSQQKFANDLYLSLNLQINDSESGYNLAYFSLFNKALLLSIASQTKMPDKNLPSDMKNILQELYEKKKLFSHLLLSPPEIEDRLLTRRQEELQENIDTLERKVGLYSSQFADRVQKTTIVGIQKKLSVEQVVIDFTVFDKVNLETLEYQKRIMVAVLIYQDKMKMIPLGNYQELQKLMTEFRSSMTATTKHTYKKEISQKLYQILWQPIASNLENVKTVTIIPDAALHMLPFASLCDKNGRYLLENITIETCSSLRDLFVDTKTNSNGNVVIFADPDYGKSLEVIFTDLPATQKESLQIRNLLTSKNIPHENYEKKDATKENLLQIKNPRLLHLATHGFFNETKTSKEGSRGVNMSFLTKKTQQEMFTPNKKSISSLADPLAHCGLVFAGANTNSTQASILLGSEIPSLSLGETELVTLSACETGLGTTTTVTSSGEVFKAEEVFSLRRAFQEAGAKAVLSTMWGVNDEATQKFMSKFYEYYFNKVPPQQAIRAVQYEFLQDEEYWHPYFWAGFVLVGTDKQFTHHTKNIEITVKVVTFNKILLFSMLFLVCTIICCLVLLYQQKQEKFVQRQTRRKKRIEDVRGT